MTDQFADKPDVVIVAGAGAMPVELAEAAGRAGHRVGIVPVMGFADADMTGFDVVPVGLGEVGKIRAILTDLRAPVVFSGRFARPDLDDIRWDFGVVPILPKVLKTRRGGDDTVMRLISSILDDWRIELLGPADIAPDLVIGAGLMAGKTPDRKQMTDIRLGFDLVAAMARFDVGQSVIVHNERVIAVEAAEGTDAMLDRCADLRAKGRFRAKGRAGIMIKRAKPGQDLRTDMPVIGAETVRAAERAGLAGIALEAGKVLFAGRAAVIEAAQAADLFVFGQAGEGAP